jgi:hypothetical protein
LLSDENFWKQWWCVHGRTRSADSAGEPMAAEMGKWVAVRASPRHGATIPGRGLVWGRSSGAGMRAWSDLL